MIQTGGNLTRGRGIQSGGLLNQRSYGAAAFSPSSISGLAWWLKGDTGVYKDAGVTAAANGDTVAQWNDQSGNGRNASATAKFTYVTPDVNGLGACTSASSKSMAASAANLGATFTYFAIFNPSSLPAHAILAGHDSGAAANNGWRIQAGSANPGLTFGGVADYGTGLTMTANKWTRMCITCSGNGGTATFYLWRAGDVSEQTTSFSVGTMVGTPNRFTVSNDNFSSAFGFVGDIAETVIYDHVITSTDRTNLNTYTTSRYGF